MRLTLITIAIEFEWDSGNQDKNWIKHHVSLKEIEEVFFNKPLLINRDITHSVLEKRFIAYGHTNQARQLIIVFTMRKQMIRAISARDQNKKERAFYETNS